MDLELTGDHAIVCTGSAGIGLAPVGLQHYRLMRSSREGVLL
jgi:hypothetical protein